MKGNTALTVIILTVALLWAGSSIYGHYTYMRSSVAQAEAKAREMEAMFNAVCNASLASARVNQEALNAAIERLAEGKGK